jgi:hypothetical protein
MKAVEQRVGQTEEITNRHLRPAWVERFRYRGVDMGCIAIKGYGQRLREAASTKKESQPVLGRSSPAYRIEQSDRKDGKVEGFANQARGS